MKLWLQGTNQSLAQCSNEGSFSFPLLPKCLCSFTAEQIRNSWSDWSVDVSGFEDTKWTELMVRCLGIQRRKEVERLSTCPLWEFVFELEVWRTKAEQSFRFKAWVSQAAGAKRRSQMGNLQKLPRIDICLTWLFVRFSLRKEMTSFFISRNYNLKPICLISMCCGKFHSIVRSLSQFLKSQTVQFGERVSRGEWVRA